MKFTNLAFRLKSELDELRPISSELEFKIMQKFRLDWNFHSSRIEGNNLTYGETKALILFNITAQLAEEQNLTFNDHAKNQLIEYYNY